MKFKNTLFVVEDIEMSKKFYKEVLGLRVIMDFGDNITLTSRISLQSRRSWTEFIGKVNDEISFGGNDSELYFEEDDFDGFINKIKAFDHIKYVHTVYEHSWG